MKLAPAMGHRPGQLHTSHYHRSRQLTGNRTLSSGESVGHDQPGPGLLLRAGYRPLGIRDRENIYELPRQHQQPTGENSTTQL
jgi:hypothetical protein